MRTTTPASTCAVMTACGESTTSPESSTPRLTGPGVHQHLARRRRRPLIWYQAAYSRSEGTQVSLMRSRCMRSA